MAYSMLKTVSTGNGGGLGGSSGVGQLAGNVATRLPPTNPLRVNTPLNRTSLSTMTVPKSATLYPSDDVFIELLRSTDFDVQLSAISRLLSLSRKDDNWFRNFTKKADLFQCFDQILRDSKWEVQHQCIKLLADTMHQYGPDLEWCMTSLLPAAVLRLGSGKITIRRVTVQALVSFLRLKPEAVHTFQKAVVNQALTQTDPNALKEVLRELPSVFISELVTKNWAVLVDGLTNLLLTADEETASLILAALEKLLGFVGQQEFNGLIHSIPEKQRTNYEVMLMQRGSAKGRSMAAAPKGPPAIIDASGDKRYRFGIVPVHIFEQLNNDAEPKVRIHGLEQLKAIMERLTDEERARLIPHLHAYLVTMGNVLDDLNFKVVVLALDLLRLTVSKLTTQIDAHLQHVVSIMGKHFGNQKAVIKQLIMMTSIDLMQHLQPKPVIAVLCIYFQHRNSRVREEVINIITAALMKFPSNMFNLTAIAHVLAPLLTDPKRRVRLAAFEQLSVLAQTMGSGKQEPLFKCVRDVEHRQRAPGLMIAVQARLARHQLPRIRYDGLIEYSVPPAPMDNPTRPPGHQQSPDAADFEWIMSAQMGPGSAYSRSLSPTLAQRAAEQKQAGPQSQNTPTMVQSLQPKKPANAPNTSTSITNTITTVTSKANGSTQAPATVPASTTVNNTKSGSNSAPTTKSHGSVFPAQQETKATVAVAEDKKLPWELENTVTPVKKDEAKVVSAVKNAAKVMQRRKSDDQSSAVAKKKSTDDDAMRPPAIVNGSYQAPYPAKGNLQPIGFSFHRSSSVGQPPVQTLELSNPLYDELSTSLDRVRFNALQKREEYNNNNNNSVQQTLMKRTQSDGHLLAKASDHDRFDSWDDAPIKPAKSGSYSNGVSSQLPPSPRKLNLFHKKSISNTNVNQFSAPSPPIKQSNSAGSHKKPHNFLHRGASQKKPPPAPPAKPPSKMLDVPKNPAQALQFALQKISSEEWTDKVDGINLIQQLSETSPQTVVSDLHTVSTALNTECKNLRSSVSRQALTCYGQLCLNLKTKMDPEIEKACQVLMAKSGDVSSAFIREDAFQSLEHMVDHTSNCKVVPALIASGASSKTITIRSGCGQLLARLVENIGATKALNQKEVCDKIIPQSLVFVQDTQPSVRYYGKYILQLLNQDAANFDRNCKRLLSDGQMRTVKDVLTTIKNKGLGDAPANGAAPSANPTPLSNTLVRNGSVKRNAAPLRKLADSVQLDLDEIYADLSSGNWETRLTGLDRYKEMCAHNIKAVASDTRLVEAFIARLNDINGKVAAQAMETHQRTLPLMGQQFSSEAGLKAVMDQMIKALMAHLPSKNDELRYLGQSSIDATMTHIDHSCLIAPFATATKTANIKQKPFMLSMLSRLSQSVHKTKPKQVEVNTLPVLWDLMKTQSGDNAVKAALSDFSKSLARTMGKKTLLESSTGSLNSTQKADLDAIIS